MGIPLVRNNSVDDINTSIIAIKKELGKGGSSDMGDVNVNVDVKYEVTDTVEDGNSLPVTSNGVSRVINVLGVPVGCVLPFYGNTVPESFLPCNGVAFDEHQYPALYALLGTNVLPTYFDHSRLDVWENIEFPLNTEVTMPYDGIVVVGRNGTYASMIKVIRGNSEMEYGGMSSINGALQTIEITVQKGDILKTTHNSWDYHKVAYYKHYLCIKATSGL
jgi:hypothetical protein